MGLFGAIKAIIYKLDLLDSGSLLRIKGEPEHKTLLGGIISFSLMVLLAAAFWNKIVATFNKTIITSTTTQNNADDPLPFSISTLPNGPFMLGVEILNHNLNGNIRYFDIELSTSLYSFGSQQNKTEYKLQGCTKDHWIGYPKIQNEFDSIGIGNWLCLPRNNSFDIRGKYSSIESKTLNIMAKKCQNYSLTDVRPCANQTQVDQLFSDNNGYLFYSIYFLNPIINADNQKYIDYYLQDSNYIIFSQSGGEQSRLFVEDYSILTDQSILPNQDIVSESGGMITSTPLKSTFSLTTDVYGSFFIFKSSTSLVYNRSFQKLDDVFSYIGGLFGTILILFFLISAYNTYKFQINIAGYLYHKQERAQSAQKKYNFIYYIGQLIYTALKLLHFSPEWEKLSYYYQTREEILKQLDVLLLIKRINFIEKAMTYLFSQHQLQGMYLANHFTIEEAVALRKKYKLKTKLKQQIQGLRNSKRYSYSKQEKIEVFEKNEFMKVNRNKTNDSFAEDQQVIDNQFNSDRYSSQQSSQEDDGNFQIFQSLKILSKQTKDNKVSKKIWRNIDKRVQTMIHPILEIEQKKGELLRQDNYEQLTINNYNSKDNMQQITLQPFFKHKSEPVQTSQKDLQYEKEMDNINYAKLIFSKIQTVHPEIDNQVNGDGREN